MNQAVQQECAWSTCSPRTIWAAASGVQHRGTAVEQTPKLCTTADIRIYATDLPRSTSLLSEISLARSSIVILQRFGTTQAGSPG